MTRLEHVAVEGFKGVEKVAFDPGMVNVVTGRNKSGKTSLLEAIHLLCSASNISDVRPADSGLIRTGFESAQITGEFVERRIEMTVRMPTEAEILEAVSIVAEEVLLLYHNGDESEVADAVVETLEDVVPELPRHVDVDELKHGTVVVTSPHLPDSFPYFTPDLGEATLQVCMEAVERLQKEHGSFESDDSLMFRLHGLLDDFVGSFVGDLALPMIDSEYIDVLGLSNTVEFDALGEEPVIVDDVGDFLREREIIDELKTFSFDHVVFENGDDKYAVPFDAMGDGFKAITAVVWHLLEAKANQEIALLEEPETHMHPGYVRQLTEFLIDLARDEEIQLFVTTHNHDFLNDFFDPALPDEEREFLRDEFRLIQMQDGYAGVKSYEEAEESLKDLQIDLRGI